MSSTPPSASPPSRSRSRRRDWSDLPCDAVVSILRRFIPPPPPPPSAFTLAHFSAAAAALVPFSLVSRSWRAAGRAVAAELVLSLPPLLWECPPYYRSVYGESIFYSPFERRPYRKPMAALSRLVSCVGFSHGYLVATVESPSTAVTLAVVNPFTGYAVRGLPPLPEQVLTSSSRITAALSEPPASLGCMLMVFGPGVVFHARISDPVWATETVPADVGRVLSVATVGRKIYTLTSNWKLLVLELISSSSSSLRMSVLQTESGDLPPWSTVSLADSGAGDLLAVQAVGCDSFFSATGKFAVYRMEFDDGRPKWVRLRGLGSKVLFVDCYGHVVSGEAGTWGGKENCVYFTSVHKKAVGVFNMENGSVEYLPSNMRCYRATDMWVLPGVCFF